MIYKLCLAIALLAGHAAAAPVEHAANEAVALVEAKIQAEHEAADQRGRELFPMLVGQRCQRYCAAASRDAVKPMMSISDQKVKALEMLALNDEMDTVVKSDSMCTRRHAMARAAGLAAGLGLAAVQAPGFAAETKMVKMGSDSGQLVFVPDELKICKGDSVTWTNNKGGPHNVVFDEEAIPDGVDQGAISMDDQLGDEGATFTKKFDVAGTYAYYCEPHRGAGMQAELVVA